MSIYELGTFKPIIQEKFLTCPVCNNQHFLIDQHDRKKCTQCRGYVAYKTDKVIYLDHKEAD